MNAIKGRGTARASVIAAGEVIVLGGDGAVRIVALRRPTTRKTLTKRVRALVPRA